MFAAACAALYKVGSLWLVGLASCVGSALLIFWLLPRIWMNAGVNPALTFLTLAAVQTPHWFNARPQLCSYFFLLAFLSILEKYRKDGSKLLWLLPPLMVLWVNVHSFWFIGLFALITYTAVSRCKKLLAVTAACIAAVFVNPYGAQLPAYVAAFATPQQYSKIYELQPWLTSAEYWWTLLFVPFAAFVLWKRRAQIPTAGFILAAVATVAALLMRRFEPICVLMAWPYLAIALAPSAVPSATARFGWKKFALPAAALALPVFTWYSQFPTLPSAWMVYTEDTYPLLKIVQDHVGTERIFETPIIGSWMLAMNPASEVFVDSRFDAYPKQFLQRVDDCLEATEPTLDQLDQMGIQHVVVRDDMPLAHLLISSPTWYVALDDGMVSWWIRTSDTARLTEWQIDDMGLPAHIATATAQLRTVREQHLQRIQQQMVGATSGSL